MHWLACPTLFQCACTHCFALRKKGKNKKREKGSHLFPFFLEEVEVKRLSTVGKCQAPLQRLKVASPEERNTVGSHYSRNLSSRNWQIWFLLLFSFPFSCCHCMISRLFFQVQDHFQFQPLMTHEGTQIVSNF